LGARRRRGAGTSLEASSPKVRAPVSEGLCPRLRRTCATERASRLGVPPPRTRSLDLSFPGIDRKCNRPRLERKINRLSCHPVYPFLTS
jgi:hypothetical protein